MIESSASFKNKSFRNHMLFVLAAFIITALITVYSTSFMGETPLPWWEVAITVVAEALIFLSVGYFGFDFSNEINHRSL